MKGQLLLFFLEGYKKFQIFLMLAPRRRRRNLLGGN
jgi:hypothetical protein